MDEPIDPEAAPPDEPGGRWRARPRSAATIQIAVLILPLATGFATTGTLIHRLDQPSTGAQQVAWWAIMITVTIAVMVTVSQLFRPLLPLSRLMRLDLDFPGASPSRISTARAAWSPGRREQLVSDLRDGSADADRAAFALVVLAARLTVHDRLNAGHAERVLAYAHQIGEQMGLRPDELRQLHWAALVHDIGKIAVSADLLATNERPSERQLQKLRDHTSEGDQLVRPLRGFLGAAVYVPSEHHEWYDGTGYPLGLRGDEISVFGRIVAAADVFDVLTAFDSYRPTRPAADALAELDREAGSQFDPVVVRAAMDAGLRPARFRGPGGVLADVTQTGVRAATLLRSVGLVSAAAAAVVLAAQNLPAPAQLVQVTVDRADAALPELGGAIDQVFGRGAHDGPPTQLAPVVGEEAAPAPGSTGSMDDGGSAPGGEPATDPTETNIAASAARTSVPSSGSSSSTPNPGAPMSTGSTTTAPSSESTTTTTSPTTTTSSGLTTTSTTSTTIPAPASGPVTWWLANTGEGDTEAAPVLPLELSAPTAAQPANYDTDRDTGPGLWIRKGVSGLETTDPKRVQVWSIAEPGGRTVSGSVQLRIWAATRGFNPARSGEVVAALERCNTGGCSQLATDQVAFDGATDWVELIFAFGTIAETWAAGDEVVVRVAVPAASGDHPWIAYDSLATPARLVVAG